MGDAPTSDAALHPPRYWWLKRIALISVAWLAAVVCLRIGWGYHTQRKFDAAIAELRTRGEPLLPADFDKAPKVPDAENSALVYRRAIAALPSRNVTSAIGRVHAELPLTDSELALLRQLQPQTQAARAAYRQARFLSGYDPGIVLRSPLVAMRLPGGFDDISLAMASRDEALLKCAEGDHAAALACVRDMLANGRRVSASPAMVAVLAGALVCDQAAAEAALVARNWQPADGGASEKNGAATDAAFRAEAKAVIAALLDDAWICASLTSSLQFYRAMYLEVTTPFLDSDKLLNSVLPYPLSATGAVPRAVLRPVLQDGIVASLPALGRQVDAARSLGASTLGSAAPDWSSDRYAGARFLLVRPFSTGLMDGQFTRLRLQIARCRAAAVALAIRLYAMDHGSRPATLEQLVPDYLPAVPADPCSASHEPLHYRADGPRPAVWSVGSNGQDDGGDPLRGSPTKGSGEPLDLIIPLTGAGTAPRPVDAYYEANLKKALDEQLNKANAPGQDNEAREGQD